jgi:ornithine carbamoyltransferase
MSPKHFLDIDALDAKTLRAIIDWAHEIKRKGHVPKRLKRQERPVLAMIFEKPSTRTRVSFEVAIHQLGGQSLVLSPQDMQLGRGETLADTARVLSRYVDAIMLRTGPHATLTELAAHSNIPVINGLTCLSHPCQAMADIMTFEELKGPIEGRTIAWIGDANNVATSWVHADKKKRSAALRPFQVDGALMALAAKDAIFMHCLPAHRGDEVTAQVIDGPQSVVWDEAENRLHAQKAILAWCLGAEPRGGKAARAKRRKARGARK